MTTAAAPPKRARPPLAVTVRIVSPRPEREDRLARALEVLARLGDEPPAEAAR